MVVVAELAVFSRLIWFINCGAGTNTKAELMGLWATLTLGMLWSIKKLQILGRLD